MANGWSGAIWRYEVITSKVHVHARVIIIVQPATNTMNLHSFSVLRSQSFALLIALLAMVMAATHAHAQDYAREARWAAEFGPGLVDGDEVRLQLPSNSGTDFAGRSFVGIYTPAKQAVRGVVVLVHGVGVHPDFGVIGILRQRLSDVGYATLSIQMPVQGKDAQVDSYYPAVFPQAIARIDTALQWVVNKKISPHIALLSHSMGSWMSNEYLDARHRTSPTKAWVCLGLTGGYSWGMRRYTQPVLDVFGEQDVAPNLSAKGRRSWALNTTNGSQQAMINGADHNYTGKEEDLTR